MFFCYIISSCPVSLSSRKRFLCSRSAFTLIELLIVIAIIAILSVVLVITLNPTELLRQSRDSARISDLATVNTALGLFNTDQSGSWMGTSSVVYVSIPDTTSTCANLGLPTLPTGYTYACATQANHKRADGNGWIPINFTQISFGAPLSTLPVDPVNTTSTYEYYTYLPGGSWKLTALSLESQKFAVNASNDGGTAQNSYEIGSDLTLGSTIFPSGWVKVPGNGTFGTSDFWVMKYEAKCILASSGAALTAPDTGYHTYSNSSQPCTGSYYPASTASGYPIGKIGHNTALSYCTAIGAHLLTNDEYMTIATNAANVSSNWKNGVIGSTEASGGGMYRGNTNSSLGMDGTDPLSGTYTRTWTLSNGSVVWDMAGNVLENVQRSTMNSGDLTTTITTPTCSSGTGYCQYGTTGAHITAWNDASFSAATIGPPDGSWNSSQGIGSVAPADTTAYGSSFSRGGYWDYNGSNAGAFAINLIRPYNGTNAYDYVGFRCAR